MLKIILFVIILFLSNSVQAVTGFAGTMLAMPASIKLIGVDESKFILNVIAILSCLIISVREHKYINKAELKKMTIYMIVGMFIGILIFKICRVDILLYIYGAVIITIALKKLLVKKELAIDKKYMFIIIIIAGIIHGMFVSGGALLVAYAAMELKNKNEFRATLSAVWVIMGIILLICDIGKNIITINNIKIIIMSLIPLMLSIYMGNKIYKYINQYLFLKLSYILLLLSGIIIFI